MNFMKGEEMSNYNLAKKIIEEANGFAKYSDFTEAGVKPAEITKLCREGYIERIRHGYYQLHDAELIAESRMLTAFLPEAIVSMESALFYYGYSDFTPRKWTVTVPRTISRTKIHACGLPLQVYYVQEELHQIGIASGYMDGTQVPVYDRERTICDCFKYQSKIDNELFAKALNSYIEDKDKNLVTLTEYAKKLHVYNKMKGIMEVLLNG